MAVYIETSGWSYAHWTNVLYPEDLRAGRRLDQYARQFQTVELNASYYRWPSDSAFVSWQRRLPEGFIFTVIAPGALDACETALPSGSMAGAHHSGARPSGSRRGVLLVQLPPSSAFDRPRLAYFLERVPRGLDVCFEFRNPAWLQGSIFALLDEHGAGYCVMSGAGLVSVDSPLGRHKESARTLAFAESDQWIADGVTHTKLLTCAPAM